MQIGVSAWNAAAKMMRFHKRAQDGWLHEIYDLEGNKTSEFKAERASGSSDLIGRDSMTDAHFANFLGANS